MAVEITGLTYNDEGYYEINDAQDLVDLATYVNAGNNCEGLTFKVTAQDGIDMSSVENFTSIGTTEYEFRGTFNGNGKTISNPNTDLFVNADDATIQNLRLVGTAGNDVIKLGNGSNVSIDTSAGDDTIQVNVDKVTDFTVENFTAGDVIQFFDDDANPVAATKLETVDGKLVATANGKTVTIGGLSLPTTGTVWELDGTIATYSTGTSEGAYIDGDKISFREADTVDQVVLGGIANAPTVNGKNVNISATNFAGDTVNVGGYSFAVAAGDYTGKTFSGSADADTLTHSGSNLVINTGAGNDNISLDGGANNTIIGGTGDDTITDNGTGGNVCVYTGENFGNDQISGFKSNDTIVIAQKFDYAIDGSTVTVTKGGATVGTINVQTAAGVTTRQQISTVTLLTA